ncbi:MAG TPA: outer membrane protein assembly factor BamD [Polyangiaceae bacterium]
MSDLKLVSPDQPTPLEQRLLDAVAKESPSAEQRLRVRLALGLPAVVAPPMPEAPVGRRALLLKAAGGLVVISVAAVALFFGMGRNSNADKPPLSKPLGAPQTSAPQPAAVDAPSEAAATGAPQAAAPSAPALNHDAHEETVASKRASKPAVVESGADLSEQLRLIDAARSAVAAGNAAAASAALSSYRTRFPRGPFGQEAAVLQIETLDLQGNHARAAVEARNFLARHPNSPHVSVVQRIANR